MLGAFLTWCLGPAPAGLFLSDDAHRSPLAGMLHQPKLLRLLADFRLVSAQHARSVRKRVAISERVREVGDIHFGPRFAGVCVHVCHRTLSLAIVRGGRFPASSCIAAYIHSLANMSNLVRNSRDFS
jgi:hypothetical protein